MADTADIGNVGRWTVRGVSRDVQRLALDAARGDGVSLGAWLSALIRTHAPDDAVGAGQPDVLADLVQRVERLERAAFGDDAAKAEPPRGDAAASDG